MFAYLTRPLSHCVHFEKRHELDGSEVQTIESAVEGGVKLVYWSYSNRELLSETIASLLGRKLGLEHVPYGRLAWAQFLDDLGALSYHVGGLAIIVDRADILLGERPDDFFRLIEAFLIQFHHWYDRKKPCHLFLQMEKDPFVSRLFASEVS